MNNYLDKFNELWSNKRYRAMIMMGGYVIFFTIVLLFAKSAKNNKVDYVSPLNSFKNKNRYSFQINYLDKTVIGEYISGNMAFYDDKAAYKYQDKVLEPDTFDAKEVLEYVDNKKIADIIENNEVFSETKYKDGTKSKTYQLNDIDVTIYEKEKIFEADIKINDMEYKILYN